MSDEGIRVKYKGYWLELVRVTTYRVEGAAYFNGTCIHTVESVYASTVMRQLEKFIDKREGN